MFLFLKIMYISVKNIYKYEILSSNNIKLENERDTTEETLCLLSPHQPIEVNIIPDCESESLQGREEPLCNSYDTYNEVTDPVIIEGTEFIKYEDHEIKNEAESESLQGREEPLGNGYDAYTEVTDPVAFEGIEFIKYEDHEIKNEAPAHHVDHSVSVAAAGLATSTNTCYYR
ncbi:uncharacterized protein LOC142333800 isoform X2 [Lycorma delicatula]|uniref:uncharacterized protein LOC142333800 isoform X2 n=1 Tax=Lycorma delicatula TaxID=130591 RepID=UPI003F514BDC